MTTYLGEKAVGIGTVKANMNVGKVITDEKTILGDGFTEQLAVNTLLFATSESVAASAEAVRTEFDGKLKTVEGEITNVEDRVRELTKATDGEFVDVKLDVSDLKDADIQIRAQLTSVEDDVRELRKGTHDELVDIKLDVSDLKDANQNIRTEIAGKQDKLTAGENITIEDGVISAAGGGGELPDNVLVNNASASGALLVAGKESALFSVAVGIDSQARGMQSTAVGYSATSYAQESVAIGYFAQCYGVGATQIGDGLNSDANTFKVSNQNGNFEMMSADGTIPAERMSATAGTTGQVLTKTDTGMEWQDATGGGGDYLPLSGGTLTGNLEIKSLFNSSNQLVITNKYSETIGETYSWCLDVMSSGYLMSIGYYDYRSAIMRRVISFTSDSVVCGRKEVSLGSAITPWRMLYAEKLNNGADIAIPTTGGTMALKEDIDAVVGDISTSLTAILGE